MIYPNLESFSEWQMEYRKVEKDINRVVEATKYHRNILILKKYQENLKDCLDAYFESSQNFQLMKRDDKEVLVKYEEKYNLTGNIPPLAIIQLGFRRSRVTLRKWNPLTKMYVMIPEDMKDSRDVDIPEKFQWKGFNFDLVGVFCHHGAEATSGHFTGYFKHAKHDNEWFHHDDNKVKRTSVHHFLNNVKGGDTQTSCAVVYRTKKSETL